MNFKTLHQRFEAANLEPTSPDQAWQRLYGDKPVDLKSLSFKERLDVASEWRKQNIHLAHEEATRVKREQANTQRKSLITNLCSLQRDHKHINEERTMLHVTEQEKIENEILARQEQDKIDQAEEQAKLDAEKQQELEIKDERVRLDALLKAQERADQQRSDQERQDQERVANEYAQREADDQRALQARQQQQADREQEQAERQQEQADREQEQAQRQQEQSSREQDQTERQQEQAERQQEQEQTERQQREQEQAERQQREQDQAERERLEEEQRRKEIEDLDKQLKKDEQEKQETEKREAEYRDSQNRETQNRDAQNREAQKHDDAEKKFRQLMHEAEQIRRVSERLGPNSVDGMIRKMTDTIDRVTYKPKPEISKDEISKENEKSFDPYEVENQLKQQKDQTDEQSRQEVTNLLDSFDKTIDLNKDVKFDPNERRLIDEVDPAFQVEQDAQKNWALDDRAIGDELRELFDQLDREDQKRENNPNEDRDSEQELKHLDPAVRSDQLQPEQSGPKEWYDNGDPHEHDEDYEHDDPFEIERDEPFEHDDPFEHDYPFEQEKDDRYGKEEHETPFVHESPYDQHNSSHPQNSPDHSSHTNNPYDQHDSSPNSPYNQHNSSHPEANINSIIFGDGPQIDLNDHQRTEVELKINDWQRDAYAPEITNDRQQSPEFALNNNFTDRENGQNENTIGLGQHGTDFGASNLHNASSKDFAVQSQHDQQSMDQIMQQVNGNMQNQIQQTFSTPERTPSLGDQLTRPGTEQSQTRDDEGMVRSR